MREKYLVKNEIKKVYFIVIPPFVFMDNAKYLGDMRVEYIPFFTLISKILVNIRSRIQTNSDITLTNIKSVKERINWVDEERKEENSELFLHKIDNPNKSLKPAYVLILFLKESDIIYAKKEEDLKEGEVNKEVGDAFICSFVNIIKQIQQNFPLISSYNFNTVSNLALSEKNAIIKKNVEKKKPNNKKTKKKKDDEDEEDDEIEKIENKWMTSITESKEITTEHILQNVVRPYSYLYLFKMDFDISKQSDEIKSPNMLDIGLYKTLFSLSSSFELLKSHGFKITDEMKNHYKYDYNHNSGGIELDKNFYFDLGIY